MFLLITSQIYFSYENRKPVGMEVRSKRIGPRLSPKKAQLCINEREMGSNQAFWPDAKGFGPKRTCLKTDHPLVKKTHPRKV